MPNKITRDLKNGLLDAAIAHGSDGEGAGGLQGYLLMCATRYPRSYMQLLGKLLPFNVAASVNSATINTVRIVSIPSGHFLSADQIARVEQGESLLLDTVPQSKQHEEPAAIEAMLAEPAAPDEVDVPMAERLRRMGAARVV
jgi:hypothetical protein